MFQKFIIIQSKFEDFWNKIFVLILIRIREVILSNFWREEISFPLWE